jgi:hypothetical protein
MYMCDSLPTNNFAFLSFLFVVRQIAEVASQVRIFVR